LDGNINTINSREVLLVVLKEVGLEETTEKTKCVFVSGEQIAGQNNNINIGSIPFEMWKSLNNWELNPCMQKVREDYIWGMPAAIWL